MNQCTDEKNDNEEANQQKVGFWQQQVPRWVANLILAAVILIGGIIINAYFN